MPSIALTLPDPWAAHTNNLADLVPSLEATVRPAQGGSHHIIRFDVPDTVGARSVRRPMMGIAVKPDTHAFVTIVRADGKGKIKVFNDLGATSNPNPTYARLDAERLSAQGLGTPQSEYWTDFLLQNVAESRSEKVQIVETFGDPVLYVFGERPRFLQFSGYLVNTTDFNWRAQFWENWEQYFRATKLVEANSRMFIGFDDILVSGYPVNASATQSSTDPYRIAFNFSFFVTSYTNFSMRQAGALQRLRLGVEQGGESAFTTRAAEYLQNGSFRDEAYDLASSATGPLAAVLGGDRLRAVQAVNELRDSLNVLGVSFFDLLNSPDLRYIKGAKTAFEVLLAHQRRIANTLAYQGVEEIAAETAGGIQGLNFWLGMISQLYRVAFVNGFRMLGLRDEPSNNKWLDLIDHTFQLSNPYAVASVLSYTASVAAASALYASTDKYELSNVSNDFARGLVARGQSSTFGDRLSVRNEFVSTQNPDAVAARPLSVTTRSISYASQESGYAAPQGTQDRSLEPQAVGVSSQGVQDSADRQRLEREAVARQNAERTVNHGAILVVEDPDEVRDDGSF